MSNEKQSSQSGEKNGSSKDQAHEVQTLTLLQDIRNGSIDPRSLRPVVRRTLVSFLNDSQTPAEIAYLLKVTDRTIQRDIKVLQEESAITKDPKLLGQMVGRLVSEADRCKQRSRKSARGNDTPASVKVDAEYRCFQIECLLIEKMQSLGYLPTAPQKIEADLIHRPASSLTLEEIQIEAGRVKQIQESLPAEEIKQADSAIEANETVTEFEDNSPQQDNNKGGNNHEPTK